MAVSLWIADQELKSTTCAFALFAIFALFVLCAGASDGRLPVDAILLAGPGGRGLEKRKKCK